MKIRIFLLPKEVKEYLKKYNYVPLKVSLINSYTSKQGYDEYVYWCFYTKIYKIITETYEIEIRYEWDTMEGSSSSVWISSIKPLKIKNL